MLVDSIQVSLSAKYYLIFDEEERTVIRPKALVTAAELLEIDRSTTQTFGDCLISISLNPFTYPTFFLLCTILIRPLSLSASRQKPDPHAKYGHYLKRSIRPQTFPRSPIQRSRSSAKVQLYNFTLQFTVAGCNRQTHVVFTCGVQWNQLQCL